MKQIIKGKETKQLNHHRNSGGTWDDFSLDKGKKETKEQLLKEQNNLCAYCTRSINFKNMKLEHWCARSTCPTDRSLDYSNMLAACKGISGKEQHCDTSKADILINLDPRNQNHIQQISYKMSTGKIQSSNSTHQHEIDQVLRLNIDTLKKERKTIITTLKLGLHKKYKGKVANYQKELKKWEDQTKPFCMIAIAYLDKKVLQQTNP